MARTQQSAINGALKRRQLILDAIAKDPCALDLIVWAGTPMTWPVVQRIFEACVLTEPPIRWAMIGPSEQELTRVLRRLHTSLPSVPEFMMPDAPSGSSPYTLQVTLQEEQVLNRLTSRATVMVHASEMPLPISLKEICSANSVDLIDAGCCEVTPDSRELKLQILDGAPRRTGGTIHLGAGRKTCLDGLPFGVVLEDNNGSARAIEAVALLKALVDAQSLQQHTWPHNAGLNNVACTPNACEARSRL